LKIVSIKPTKKCLVDKFSVAVLMDTIVKGCFELALSWICLIQNIKIIANTGMQQFKKHAKIKTVSIVEALMA
jgi:hypothetical protein